MIACSGGRICVTLAARLRSSHVVSGSVCFKVWSVMECTSSV